ncbi:MAG: hypothetical protein P1U89_09400 [Verrucomicrobiales bacterium]|nr:hypothetical protein [Verrucomicrobiales bacterium]
MRFLEDRASTFSAAQVIEEDEMNNRGNLFTWLIVIMVLLGLNIGSWSFCNMVFGHPEHPFSYGLLTKLEKLDPLKGFTSTAVPGGKFRSAKDLYTEAYPFKRAQLRAYNGILKRNYLWNYKERSPATFIYGAYIVEEIRALTETDLFPKGIVITATAYKFPDAKVELILPTAEPVEVANQYKIGDTLEIGKSSMAAAVINAEKGGPDDPMKFTAVPLITKSSNGNDLPYKTTSGETLLLRTPEWLNID